MILLAIVILLLAILVIAYFLLKALIAAAEGLVFLTIALVDLIWDHTPHDPAKADQQWL